MPQLVSKKSLKSHQDLSSESSSFFVWFRQQSRRFGFFVAKAFCIVCNPYFWFTPTVLSELETIKLLASGKSIGRYGDGEIALIMGTSLYFQRYSDELANELVRVLTSDDPRFIVAIPTIYGAEQAKLNTKYVDVRLWRRFEKYSKLVLPKSKIFGSAFITRPIVKNIATHSFCQKLRTIWQAKTIVYVNYDSKTMQSALFANAKKRLFIPCPKEHAYEQIDLLEKKCLSAPKTAVFLLAAGPTATVLAHRLAKQGRQAIDIGHLPVEYEAYSLGTSAKALRARETVRATSKMR